MKSKNNFTCMCEWCIETRNLAKEFGNFIPTTKLQSRMKKVIEKIEIRYLKRQKKLINKKCQT
jgi:hypothetical protein